MTVAAANMRRVTSARRSATLLATARLLHSSAIDDALDLFAVFMVSKLIGPAERASVAERLRSLPQLAKASATLAIAARVLLELAEAETGGANSAPTLDPAAAWARLQAVVDRDQLAAAVATVEELTPDAVVTPRPVTGRSCSNRMPRCGRSCRCCQRWYRWLRPMSADRCCWRWRGYLAFSAEAAAPQ